MSRKVLDIDFCITAEEAPDDIKTKLLALPNSPFKQLPPLFLYMDGPHLIQINIFNVTQLPYLPSAATIVGATPSGFIPYISLTDLVVFKISACGLRPDDGKKQRHATDAYHLLNMHQQALQLSTEQKAHIEPALWGVIINLTKKTDKVWWNTKLGL
ncbi:hypothetical protein E8E13_003629 [Curvularia kusanoi]|uniref:Uncharacterized protein n=1 Tax=Curvularia kusanoi TaxID=90978 RepID=A0A9P4TB75_CURKU|nr:hypothetical protein E8E13_003629 [Curvularia kusanoi]